MNNRTIHRTSGRVMLGLSLFALLLVGGATVLTRLGRFDPAPGGDEGTAAHLFQLAILLIAPTGLTFLATAEWDRPASVLKRLLVPAVVLVVALWTLYHLEH